MDVRGSNPCAPNVRIFIVYAHPSRDSFTRLALDAFVKGLESSGHECVVSDLYEMDFVAEMSEAEYLREAYYRGEEPVAEDVRAEHEKINSCDAIAFVFPLFWSEAPAKLVGWFDRVWTYGFAYGDNREMRTLEKGIALCSAGNTMEYFRETGILGALETILGDRLRFRVKSWELVVLDGTSRETSLREENMERNLDRAFRAGADL